MALKRKIKTIEGLDEHIAKLYAKGTDGEYTLDVEGIEPESDTVALRNARDMERDKAAELKKKLDALEAEKAAKEEELLKKTGNTEALEKSYKEREAKSEAKYKAEIAARDKEIDQFHRGSAIDRALDGKVLPKAKEWIKRDILERTRLELDANGKRVIRVLDDSGNPTATSLDEYIKSNVFDNKDNAAFIIAGGASGSGAGGANAGSGTGAGRNRITDAQYEAMSPGERVEFFGKGGKFKE